MNNVVISNQYNSLESIGSFVSPPVYPVMTSCLNTVILNLQYMIDIAEKGLRPLWTPTTGLSVNLFIERLYKAPRSTPGCRQEILNLIDDLVDYVKLNPLAADEVHELINECDQVFDDAMFNIFSLTNTEDHDMFSRFCFRRWVDNYHALFELL